MVLVQSFSSSGFLPGLEGPASPPRSVHTARTGAEAAAALPVPGLGPPPPTLCPYRGLRLPHTTEAGAAVSPLLLPGSGLPPSTLRPDRGRGRCCSPCARTGAAASHSLSGLGPPPASLDRGRGRRLPLAPARIGAAAVYPSPGPGPGPLLLSLCLDWAAASNSLPVSGPPPASHDRGRGRRLPLAHARIGAAAIYPSPGPGPGPLLLSLCLDWGRRLQLSARIGASACLTRPRPGPPSPPCSCPYRGTSVKGTIDNHNPIHHSTAASILGDDKEMVEFLANIELLKLVVRTELDTPFTREEIEKALNTLQAKSLRGRMGSHPRSIDNLRIY
ncbi:formin-2-like [Narcine bancroftii]|uniref:formin-2-like n=1 Tax=Narcine bancroftii TaxID=1343680 RepID=UPI003831F547